MKNTEAAPTPRKPRRKITLIEVLVVIAVSAVVLRFLYYVVNWRDLAEAIAAMTPFEWAIAIPLAIFLTNVISVDERGRYQTRNTHRRASAVL